MPHFWTSVGLEDMRYLNKVYSNHIQQGNHNQAAWEVDKELKCEFF